MTKLAKIRYPVYDQNGWKTLLFGAAHTYIAHIREYSPSPPGLINNIAQTIQQLLDLESFYVRFNCVSPSAAFPGGNV